MLPTFHSHVRRALLVGGYVCVLSAEAPKAVFPEASFQFGKAVRGAVVEHTFVVKNAGSAPLSIKKVRMTPPLMVTSMPAQVMPGAESVLRFKLDTSEVRGAFDGVILISVNDPDSPEPALMFEGQVVGTVEVAPMPVFIVSAQRGETKVSSVEIINHEADALRIESVEYSTERFATSLETLEKGQRYRLTLTLKPDGPQGRNTDTILLHTSNKANPVVRIAAYTYLHERVYTFPDAVDLGSLRITEIRQNPGLLGHLAQTLMVYQLGGTDFLTTITTDIPALSLKSERGPKRDRYQTTIMLMPERIHPGAIEGSIVIKTNDAEFREVQVPVTGVILDR